MGDDLLLGAQVAAWGEAIGAKVEEGQSVV